ncbi:MAG: type IIL restriction-modification enzyme MmeI [Gemmataceae bacterium]
MPARQCDLPKHHGCCKGPAFSPDGKKVAVELGSVLQIFDVATGKPVVSWPSYDGGFHDLTFSADGRNLFVNHRTIDLSLNHQTIDTATWRQRKASEDPSEKFEMVQAVSLDRTICVAADGKHEDAVFDMKTGRVLTRLQPPAREPGTHSGFLSPKASHYVMQDRACEDKEVDTVFAVPTGKRLWQLHFPPHRRPLAIRPQKRSNNTSQNACCTDVTKAHAIQENLGICLIGPKKAGEFNIPLPVALEWCRLPNPNLKPNSDVLAPWINGTSLVGNHPAQWIVDTGPDMPLEAFCLYEAPYNYVLEIVKPDRDKNKELRTRKNWWIFKRVAPDVRNAAKKLDRYLATVRHAKHRIFVWVPTTVVCDDGIYVFARSEDYFFGILQSRLHEAWARAQGTQVRDRESGFRYTPTTCFETFPFPNPTEAQRDVIAAAAKELDALRSNWLNPPEWTREELLEFPGSADGPWSRYVHNPDQRGIGAVRYPRLVAKDEETARKLQKRTLTNLYNERPTWLALAHQKLDAAVFAAYGWQPDMSDEAILSALLALNLERASARPLHANSSEGAT